MARAIATVANSMVIDLTLSNDELCDFGVAEFNRSAHSLMRAGMAFAELKRRLPHGEFEAALEARDMQPRRAQEAIRIAEMLQSLPEKDRKVLVSLPPSKVTALASTDPDFISELIESGELEGATVLSIKDLIREWRKEKQRAVDAETTAEAADLERRRIVEQHGKGKPRIDKEYAAIRDQGVYLAECVEHEVRLAADLIMEKLSPEGLDAAARVDCTSVAALLYHALRGTAAGLDMLLATMEDRFGAEITNTEIAPERRYQPSEREQLRSLREAALTASETEFRQVKGKAQKEHKVKGRHVG